MKTIRYLTGNGEKRHLTPLFWQHHESEEVLREEIARMDENGVGDFIAEARPHPDYLGEQWWEDMSILIDEAKKRDMHVIFFDDGSYPSGTAEGRIVKQYPEFVKRYLAEDHIDACGPMEGSSFFIQEWMKEGDQIIGVAAARRTAERNDNIDGTTLIDLTDRIQEGTLYWNVPEGDWRVFVFRSTRYGGEDYTKDYLNPLDKEACRAFIDLVYEEHYRHFGDEFGKTVTGFFTDEPRFGNAATYDGRLGKKNQVLPWSDSLGEELNAGRFGNFVRVMACLWYEAGEITPDVRYCYGDIVSRRFAKNFIGQIGEWCRAHSVELIGHFVEEEGANARFGYGPGHWFRAADGMDNAGIDVVCNIYPGNRDGRFNTAFNFYDSDFNHWGLSKMASSAAHIDPKKHGTALCECFGAYGWAEGLKTMKWVTDAMCVRGINRLVLHAFSPHEFPDPDCPPHFYSRGHNPQFRMFWKWSGYANRVCSLLSGGDHVATAAVLYHAEAEWGGRAMPFEKAVKELMLHQIDCDVIPADVLEDDILSRIIELGQGENALAGGIQQDRPTNFISGIRINRTSYRTVVIPEAEYLPEKLLRRLARIAENGVPVYFINTLPKRAYYGESLTKENWRWRKNIHVCPLSELSQNLISMGLFDIRPDREEKKLVFYHYRKEGTDLFFLTNEDLHEDVDCFIDFGLTGNLTAAKEADGREPAKYFLYDAMHDECIRAEQGKSGIRVTIPPFGSLFAVFGAEPEGLVPRAFTEIPAGRTTLPIDGKWKIEKSAAEEYPIFSITPFEKLGNLALPERLPNFAGTLRYSIDFHVPENLRIQGARCGGNHSGSEAPSSSSYGEAAGRNGTFAELDLGNASELVSVKINGVMVGTEICPPYRFRIPVEIFQNDNHMEIEVVNTLAKRRMKEPFSRYWPQDPTGLLGPVKLYI